ncbi:helix-turn-helix domain-containing protein [Bdellovibrio sp. NC01]|uniref:AraC family transcriptional regulator n=1 Tax=Bdellovibrio sp. NC01 TaxID=2220073 RepID=UPI001158D68E|nr:helix-turn-helix domain-containing protein [Bdellovibrio sp. NC01]QDK37709.1 hypothetical protein DOE51_08990 [Bdellovibrio sp. NC01]
MNSLPKLQRTQRKGFLDLWEADMNGFTGELECRLSGLELLLPPYPVKKITADGQTFAPHEQSVLIFNQVPSHTEKYLEATAAVRSIVIDSEYVNGVCEPLAISSKDVMFHSFELQKDQYLTNLLQFASDLTKTVEDAQFSLDCALTEILHTLFTRHQNSKSELFQRESQLGNFPSVATRIKKVIFENIENPNFDLNVLTKEAGISKFHLIRVFKKETGLSPAKYIMQAKMDLAKMALRKTKKSVLTIAVDLGFSDLSTFNKAFKKATGVSPRIYRAS